MQSNVSNIANQVATLALPLAASPLRKTVEGFGLAPSVSQKGLRQGQVIGFKFPGKKQFREELIAKEAAAGRTITPSQANKQFDAAKGEALKQSSQAYFLHGLIAGTTFSRFALDAKGNLKPGAIMTEKEAEQVSDAVAIKQMVNITGLTFDEVIKLVKAKKEKEAALEAHVSPADGVSQPQVLATA